MFALTRKWAQLRSSINAISVAGATNVNMNNSVSHQAQYHWAIKLNAEQITLQASPKYMLKIYQRTLSTMRNHSVPKAARVTVSSDENRQFMAVFPGRHRAFTQSILHTTIKLCSTHAIMDAAFTDVVRELAESVESYKIQEVANWFTKALQYNLSLGKKNRGLLTVLAYKNLVKPDELTPENLKLAQYLGWYVEMLQCFFLISDDIMDNSTTRRGQLCWHKLEEVGLIAVNDALMIESGIFELLHKNFRHLDCYVDLIELFHQISFITTCGQSMDMLNANKNVSTFTMDKYNSIVMNKTSYYTFYLPVALALHLAGVKDPQAFQQSKAILLDMGHLFQVQDDFLDCFGNPDITGKIGTDIQDNKCSWLAVACMQGASPEQKAIMEECYGQKDPEKIARVKQLYEELDIASSYAIYEEEIYNRIKALIQKSPPGIPHEIFLQILNKIYHRDA